MRPIENCYVVPDTRLIAGEYPGTLPGDVSTDLEEKLAQFLDAGVTVFLDLTDPADGLAPYETALRALAARRGIEVLYERLTIRDMDVCDKQHMNRILNAIDAYLSAGHTLYVHCWGGVGRTGTVIGCWLVRHGKSGRDALVEVGRLFATMSEAKRRWHPEVPQTKAQRRMVEMWRESATGPVTYTSDLPDSFDT